jgi:hypothetical protein
MNDSTTAIDQDVTSTSISGKCYLAIDGIVKQCITAPLLELPIDFKEWYKPTHSGSNDLALSNLGIAC